MESKIIDFIEAHASHAASFNLAPHHYVELSKGSGITDGLIRARGYFTATSPEEMRSVGFADFQINVPALIIPHFTVDGAQYFEMKADSPRLTESGKIRKYERRYGDRSHVDVPPVAGMLEKLKDPSVPLYITEGIKKADAGACRGMTIIALPGVSAWVGTNEYGGITELADWSAVAIAGRTIYIVFDSDVIVKPQVRHELYKFSRVLKRKHAKEVLPILLANDKGEKVGLDDWLVQEGNACSRLPELVERSLLNRDRPTIVTRGRPNDDIVDDAVDALALANQDYPVIFTQNGALCRVEEDERNHFKTQRVDNTRLRQMLDSAALFVTRSKEKKKDREGNEEEVVKDTPTVIPPQVVDVVGVAAPSSRRFPALEGLSACPVLSPQGIRRLNGYDPLTRWFITETQDIPTWSGSPKSAVNFILDQMLGDFPFVDDASRAHTLSLMLLPFVRSMIRGITPMHYFEATRSRTGKSKLASICLYPGLGRFVAPEGIPRDDDSMDKQLLSDFMASEQAIFLDNLRHELKSESLEKALTTENYKGRLMRTNDIPTFKVRSIFVMTSNNGKMSPDMAARCVWIRLDAKMPHPEDREEQGAFKIADIEGWTVKNRLMIVSACLAICQAWVDSGFPKSASKKGGYSEWASTMGGILECVGVPGFLCNDRELKKKVAGEDEEVMREFIQEWFTQESVIPTTVKRLREIAKTADLLPKIFASARNEHSEVIRLGDALKEKLDNVFEIESPVGETSEVILRQAKSIHGSRAYKLETASHAPRRSGESSGESCTTLTHDSPQHSPDDFESEMGAKTELGELGESKFQKAHTRPHAYTRTRVSNSEKDSPNSPQVQNQKNQVQKSGESSGESWVSVGDSGFEVTTEDIEI